MEALAKPEVGDFLSKHFVAVYDKVGTFTVNVGSDGKTPNKNGGNVAAFFCTPSGYVIHAVAGPRTSEAFLAEAKWTTAVYSHIMSDRSLGLLQARNEQGSRVATALRQAHREAAQALTNPTHDAPGRDLVGYTPSSNPRLKGLEEKGRQQRIQVHHLLQNKAFYPLAAVGPEVYMHVLGERVTDHPVELSGAPEAQQAGRTGQTLTEFYAEGGSAKLPAAKPVTPPPTTHSPGKATGKNPPNYKSGHGQHKTAHR